MSWLLAQGPLDVGTAIVNNMPKAASDADAAQALYIVSVVSVVFGAVIFLLWRYINASNEKLITKMDENHKVTLTKLDECEEDRQKLWGTVLELKAARA